MTKKAYNEALGKAIAERRNEKKWTLDDVLLLTGNVFSRSSLNAIERGTQELRIYDFFLLEKVLGKLPRPEFTVTIT